MQNYHAFDISSIGYSHSSGERQKPMQDASRSSNKSDRATAVISDGHGSAPYVRSDRGSKIAVVVGEAVLELMLDKFLDDGGFDEREMSDILKQRWTERVLENCRKDPFTSENLLSFRQDIENCESKSTKDKWYNTYYKGYKSNTSVLKAYGCTLIGVIMHENICIGLHVGDGKCVAVYDDGSCDKPIPWDEQCIANICTSMCDDDVRCRIHIFKRRPMAIFVASDGIDDTFGDGGELYNFYRKICFNLGKKGDEYIDDLKAMLPILSEKGSKDDMSIAGIYDIETIRKSENDLLRMIEKENNNSELIKLRQELVGAEYSLSRSIVALEDAKMAREKLVRKIAEAQKHRNGIKAPIKPDREISDADKTVEELDEKYAKARRGLEQIQNRIEELEHQNEQRYDTKQAADEHDFDHDNEDVKRVE